MERFLWVCLAGALGTGVRYLTSLAAQRLFGESFPWGTLIVNVLGCFLIAIVLEAGAEGVFASPTVRLAAATGFLGGLTTYSSFNFETTRLIGARALGAATLNVALTTVGCFIAGLAGLYVARRLAGG